MSTQELTHHSLASYVKIDTWIDTPLFGFKIAAQNVRHNSFRYKCPICMKLIFSNSRKQSLSVESKLFKGEEYLIMDWIPQGGTSILGGRGGLAPNFASEILVGAPNFTSKNINDKYPKFCPLNFRYDPKIGIFPQFLRLVVTELPKFFFLVDELGRTLPQILPPKLM